MREYALTTLNMIQYAGTGNIVELKNFDKQFLKTTRNRGLAGKHFEEFYPKYFLNYLLNGKFNPIMDIWAFYSEWYLFSIFKNSRERLLSSP